MAFTVSFDQSWIIRNIKTAGDLATPQSEPTSAIKVKIYPQWFKQVSLEWTIPSEWGDCKFHVYYSPGPDEQSARLTSQPLSVPFLTSALSKESSKYRHEYFTVEAILPTGYKYRSYPTAATIVMRRDVALKASEIQRREYLLLTKYTGVRSFAFKRRFYGQKCPRCWSSSQEKVLDDRCPVCFGTSFKGGYYNPIPVYIQYEPTPNDQLLSYSGRLEPNQIGAWTISMPEIADGDIIIRSGDWNVYQVVRVATTELQTNTVRQILTLTQLARTDIEAELMKMEVLDDFGKNLESLGGNFSHTRFPRSPVTPSPDDNFEWDENKDQQLPVKYHV